MASRASSKGSSRLNRNRYTELSGVSGRVAAWTNASRGLGLLALLGGGGFAGLGQSFFNNPFSDPGATMPFPMSSGTAFTELPGTDGEAGDNFLIQQGVPYNSVVGRGRAHRYRMRFGRANGSLSGGVSFSYTDNANLVSSSSATPAQDDLTISTSVGIGFEMPLGRENSLQFNLGIGFAHHLNQDNADQIFLGPSSQWDYKTRVGPIKLTIYDRISTPGSVTPNPQVSGSGSFASIDFHRFSNDAGLSGAWQSGKSTTVSSGYSIATDLGMGDKYSQQDHMTHTVSLAVFERLDRQWTVGAAGSAYMNQFLTKFQNDSKGYGAGPTLTWQPTRRLNISSTVRYSVAFVDATGVVSDTKGFAGMTYDVNAEHFLNNRMAHGVAAGSHVDLGIGSNFAQTLSANYHLSWRPRPKIGLSFQVNYNQSGQTGSGYDFIAIPSGAIFVSGAVPQLLTANGLIPLPPGTLLTPDGLMAQPRAAEDAKLVTFVQGVSYQVTDNLTAGLSYSHGIRISNLVGHDYAQNTVALSLSYAF